MDFELSQELKMLQEMTYKFALKEFTPISHEADGEEKYTPEILKKSAAQGLAGAWIPVEYGGPGVGFLGNCIIHEQMARVDLGLCLNAAASSFGSEAIYFYGTEEQKQKYLPAICAGEMIASGAYTEPNAGTDVAGYQTRAVEDGDDYVINGNKMFITNGTVAHFMVVQTVTNPDAPKRHERFSQILVPTDTPGVARTKIRGKMGIRASDTAEIALEDVRVPKTNLIGKAGRGFYQLMHFFDTTRPMVAAGALGLAQGCLDEALKYAKERKAFGAPLSSYQLTKLKLTEMAIKIEALRGLIYKSAWLMDEGKPDYTLAAMSKYFAGETAVFCANAALEIHGGYGYIDEYPVQKFYRDAKILELYEGTKEAEIMTISGVLLR